MTAGHILYNPAIRQWATNVMFCPAFEGEPADKFAGVKLITLQGWIRGTSDMGDFQYDIGAVVVSGDMSSRYGNLGLLFNQPISEESRWTSVGYPTNSPYPGDVMYQATGYSIGTDAKFSIGMTNNDMKVGSSGGPWLIANDIGVAAGLNSHGNPDDPSNWVFSPYFSTGARNVWKCACQSSCK